MDFLELKQQDSLNVYSEFLSVNEAFDLGIIPSDYKGLVPERCECGSENIIKANRKILRCCDPKCPIKMSFALAEFLNNLGVQGIKQKTCKKIVDYCLNNNLFEVPTYTEIVKVARKEDLSFLIGSNWYNLTQALDAATKRPVTFPEMVSYLAIPKYDSSTIKILSGFNSIVDLVNAMKAEGTLMFFFSRGVKDLEKIKYLADNLSTILQYELAMQVPLLKQGSQVRQIAVTGSVSVDGISVSRSEFASYCNQLGSVGGVQLFTVNICKAFNSVEYVIADHPSSSRTYLEGLQRGIVITAQEYVDRLREEVAECVKAYTSQMKN